jgi:hypothetical protein
VNNNKKTAVKKVEQIGAPMMQQIPSSGYTTPTEFVDIPSEGMLYSQEHPWHNIKSVEVKLMTAKDEDILISQNYKEKGETVNKLLESLIISPRCDVKTILEGDRDAILIHARITSFGNLIEQHRTFCSVCSSVNTMNVELEQQFTNTWKILLEQKIVEHIGESSFSLVLPKSKKKIIIRLLDFNDYALLREDAKKRKEYNLPENTVSAKIAQSIQEIEGNTDPLYIRSFVENGLSAYETNYILKMLEELNPSVDTSFTYVCPFCNSTETSRIPLGLSFFSNSLNFIVKI